MARYDFIIEGGCYFDGTGAPSFTRNLAIKDGRIARVTADAIPHDQADRVINAAGCWVTPGFLDTHTHYDAELLASPSLSESVRHGVTTVLVGSCSLSMICSEYEDASDIFTRVETVPRERVLPILKEHKTWSTPGQWVEHISKIPLGPNVVSLLGHSDLRVGVMGLTRATDRSERPAESEMQAMERLLKEALDEGFLGLSTMCLKWDKVDGDRAWSKSLPSTYARWKEIARLNKLVRKYNRVHQGAPNAATPLQVLQYIQECIGWMRRPLKTTLISQMDLKGSAYLTNLTRLTSFFTNSLRGDFRKFYGEKLSPRVWQRDFGDAIIIDCPDPSLIGKNFDEIAKERDVHVVDLFLDLVVEFGKKIRWYTTVGNHRKEVLKRIVKDPRSLITFSDAGAHIRNMAFYNLPLRLLKLVQQSIDEGDPVMSMEEAVYRLTGDQADWFGIDAGKIREGDRADIVVLDPAGFDQDLDQVYWAEMENFGLERLVNRNPGIVKAVLINGKLAVDDEEISPSLGHEMGYGSFLRAR